MFWKTEKNTSKTKNTFRLCRRGFTLVEVAIASVIAGIIFLSIVTALSMSLSVWKKTEESERCSLDGIETLFLSNRPLLVSVSKVSDTEVEEKFSDNCTVRLSFDGKYLSPSYSNCKTLYFPKTKVEVDDFKVENKGDYVEVRVKCGNEERIIDIKPL